MDPADRDVLIRSRPDLVDNIDIANGLLTHLLSRKVLNKRMVQTITYNNPPDRQVEELLDLLPKRGPTAFQQFCEALIATDQDDVVTNILQRKVWAQTPSSVSLAPPPAVSSDVKTQISSSTLSDSTTAPVQSSPLCVVTSPEVSLQAPVPVASTSPRASSLSASPAMSTSQAPSALSTSASPSASLPASVQASSSPSPSDLSCHPPPPASPSPESHPLCKPPPGNTTTTTSLPTTPQKRKPVKTSAEENEEKLRQFSPSETDSSPLKRIRSDSVICIRGENDNVIKIYSPLSGEKGDYGKIEKNVLKSSTPQGSSSVAVPKFTLPGDATNAVRADEVRYVMKHFIATDTDEDRGQEERIRLARSMLSDLPEQVLNMLSPRQGLAQTKLGDRDYGSEMLRERLSRCDSTDTMETRKPEGLRLNVSRKPAELDQPDRVASKVVSGTGAGAATLTLPTALAVPPKAQDATDGPLCVQVEECSRQFYNLHKDKSYRMVGIPRGEALIINVNEVSEKPPRRGTDIDRDNLSHLLNQLHFNPTIYNDEDDLTALGMAAKLRAFAAKAEHSTADACIICLLSHGEEGYMFGTDGKKIPLEEIFLLFDNRHCPALLNKPKIFFIQACRGGMLDHGVKVIHDEPDGGAPLHNNNTAAVQHPSMSDMLICYPTLQGYYAWRNRERGSWYIEAVVRIFMKYAKCEDVCAMLNRVNSDVSRKVSRTPQSEMDRMSQMSEYKSSLRQPYLFLYPGIGAPSVQ